MSNRITLSDVNLDQAEKDAVSRVLDSGWLSMGPETKAFEEEFAALHGTRFAVALSNGTAALHLAALALGLGPEDEVVVPSLTFVATANGFAYTGATIRFADITSDERPTLDPDAVERAITPRTRAIVPVHYAGWPADMDRFEALAEKHKLALVTDSCHAAGLPGKAGRMACYSFFPNKNMTVGEGGMVTTDDEELDRSLRLFRSHGMTSSSWDRDRGHAYEYDVVQRGFNYRLDEIRAAIGRVQLTKLEAANEARRRVTAWYRDRLRDVPVTIPFRAEDLAGTSAHVFVVLARTSDERNRLNEFLRAHDVQTSRHYPPSHLFSIYRAERQASGSLERTESFASRVITLPLHPKMTQEQVDRVCSLIERELASGRSPVRRERSGGSIPNSTQK